MSRFPKPRGPVAVAGGYKALPIPSVISNSSGALYGVRITRMAERKNIFKGFFPKPPVENRIPPYRGFCFDINDVSIEKLRILCLQAN